MARRFGHHDVMTVFDPPAIPRGTPLKCECCGDSLTYQDRLAGMASCPRCQEALAVIEFCECHKPSPKRMVIPECDNCEPFFRCQRCGRMV